MDIICEIKTLFTQYGQLNYSGEPVSQLEHALQCATFATTAQASPELVTAAFLHDIGHLLTAKIAADPEGTPTLVGVDDYHQVTALTLLSPYFSPAVLEPIRLHVDAKRYLCAVNEQYYSTLSADSQRSLILQGGAFSHAEAQQFMESPYAEQAIQLRYWDDAAKIADYPTLPLEHYLGKLALFIERQPSLLAGF